MATKPKTHQAMSSRVIQVARKKHLERWQTHAQGSTQRGCDKAWQRLRAWHLRREPLCVKCKEQGTIKEAKQVDHIRPFRGRNDPLRLDLANLQSLCVLCHQRKTLGRAGATPGAMRKIG